MTKILFSILIFLTFNANSVELNNNGKGEYHIVPLYATGNDLLTQITVTNSGNKGVALKVHIKESLKSDTVLSYNVYLPALDTWAFALGTNDNNQVIQVDSEDSCSPFITSPQPLISPDGSIARMQTGHIEIIEMATFEQYNQLYSHNFPRHSGNDIVNCSGPESAFGPNGIWDTEDTYRNTGLTPPNNSLMVEASIINVPQGAHYAVPVTTFSNFFADDHIYHSPSDSEQPSLKDANAQSLIWMDGKPAILSFNSGLEAVNALLLKNSLQTPYIIYEGIAAINTINLSFPTQHLTNTADISFCSAQTFNGVFYDRHGNTNSTDNLQNTSVCEGTNLLSFNADKTIFNSPNQVNIDTLNLGAYEGIFEITFNNPISINATDPLTSKLYTLKGVPVLGVTFNQATNANAAPGLLAQYGLSQPIIGETTINEIQEQ